MTKSEKRKTTMYWINTAIVLFCFLVLVYSQKCLV